jgi:arylsulfatase
VTCGRDGTDSVSPNDYPAPFAFTGEISEVSIDVSGEVIVDNETELQRLMTQQ